mmetsp:Transcript_5616/g.20324  ORF Transcript_5616/g.20324 Transcript_5616/m.20324 type:complete len:138 (+) Transcript_5616:164-577(+)
MFALLLAGGLRTFSVTWPLTRESVVDANGGRANFWIGISAPFSGAQHELAAAARDVCKRERFDSCDIRLENASATRESGPAWTIQAPLLDSAAVGSTRGRIAARTRFGRRRRTAGAPRGCSGALRSNGSRSRAASKR